MAEVSLVEHFRSYETKVISSMTAAGVDISNDAVGSAQGAAPHLTGQLEKGITKTMKTSLDGINIVIDSVARDKKGYNYAPVIHDGNYSLGAKSRAKGGGTSGLSGLTFAVGKEYLQRPIEMNEKAYIRHFENSLKGVRI